MLRLSDIRIGTKLAVASGLGVILVAGMVGSQLWSDQKIKAAHEAAKRQVTIELNAINAKAAGRGMMIGVRDMRLAEKAEQVNAAAESIEARYRSLAQFADKMLELVTVAANRTRVETLKADAGKYLAVGKDMQKLRNQAVAVRGTAASVAELSAADQERLLQISAAID